MACFLVPATEAIVATVATKVMKTEEKNSKMEVETGDDHAPARIPLTRKMKWLSNMLWGGAVLLAFEHVWHGEVVPWFPFLTAAGNPADASEMLHEMATVGVSMAVLITGVWVVMVLVTSSMERKELKAQKMTAVNEGGSQ